MFFCTLAIITSTPSIDQVKSEIVAQAIKYNVSVSTSLRIADCESKFKWNAKNPNSSAQGIYQWTLPTWNYIGSKGERLNYKDNIREFMLWYPKRPGWWECR